MGVKFKMDKRLQMLLKGEVLKEIRSKKNLSIIAKEAIDIIYKRTKSGKGVDDATKTEPIIKPLEPLSPGYKSFRKKNPPKGEFASPQKSNLTYTGKLLSSIGFNISGEKITLTLVGSHGKGLTNKKLGEYVQEIRPFFAIALKEQKLLFNKIRGIIREVVSRF